MTKNDEIFNQRTSVYKVLKIIVLNSSISVYTSFQQTSRKDNRSKDFIGGLLKTKFY